MNADPTLRRRVYALVLTVAAGTLAGRILGVELVYEPSLHRDEQSPSPGKRVWPKSRPLPMPTFSSNDRSRWATVRSLVEQGTYVVGRRERGSVLVSALATLVARDGLQAAVLTEAGWWVRVKKSDTGLVTQDGWETVDKVLKPDTLEFYSSKPPLLSTLGAGVYWILYHLDWTFADHPWTVVSVILLLVNWLPFLMYLALLARLLERYGTSDWGRLYVFVAAAFATLVTTFAITFNNHSVATYSALFALYPALRLWEAGPAIGPTRYFVLAGFFAAFTACNELPATAFACLLGLALLWRAPLRTLLWFVPAAAVPVAAFLITNYLAIGQLRPAYDEFGSPWYEYEGSHWRKPVPGETRGGIDWARRQETQADYAFHLLLGHHGLFSLSPIWLIAVAGVLTLPARLRSRAEPRGPPGSQAGLDLVMVLTLLLTVIVVGFYLFKSDNYGGWTGGLRWLMWLAPFWLLTMLPIADRLGATRAGRAVGYVLLAFSVLSVAYNLRNPWRHPWLYDWLQWQGWISY
jgi:hypothetical protein